ncbi:FkbM family methyltransferase [uncultured Roseibium sp.]|uniref:FkbM family methyltransferase n=1 Tax=uncultured Roseibium sp. TaxID=1936171 RepID=UPI002620F6F4|nr:FkbM family methyltransferase [uncultured Roseibium sp.]
MTHMLGHFGRRLAYKVRRKLAPKTIKLNGITLTADLQDVPKGIRKQLYQKNYESQEFLLVREALMPADRVLEVGAGIGFIGIACARICGQDNILSYEPNPAMKPVIEKNYALNGMRPNLRSKVLATAPGEVEFFFDEEVLSSSLIDRKHGCATRVAADAISEVIENYKPSALVMDVEGAEIDLLRSCNLRKINKIIIEMHPHVVGADKIEDLCGFLDESGFSIVRRIGKSYYFSR